MKHQQENKNQQQFHVTDVVCPMGTRGLEHSVGQRVKIVKFEYGTELKS